MAELYLIVTIAGEAAALPAGQVGSVVQVDEIAPVPRVAPHVAGLFALRSRVLTVIDSRLALGLVAPAATGAADAVIVTCDGHCYALIVDKIEDVIEAPAHEPSPAVLTDGWAHATLGVIRAGDQVIPLLDPSVLVAGQRRRAA